MIQTGYRRRLSSPEAMGLLPKWICRRKGQLAGKSQKTTNPGSMTDLVSAEKSQFAERPADGRSSDPRHPVSFGWRGGVPFQESVDDSPLMCHQEGGQAWS